MKMFCLQNKKEKVVSWFEFSCKKKKKKLQSRHNFDMSFDFKEPIMIELCDDFSYSVGASVSPTGIYLSINRNVVCGEKSKT